MEWFRILIVAFEQKLISESNIYEEHEIYKFKHLNKLIKAPLNLTNKTVLTLKLYDIYCNKLTLVSSIR